MIKIAWNKNYCLDLPKSHRFPMEKYELIPLQLIHEGIFKKSNFFSPNSISQHNILLTHEKNYVEKLNKDKLSGKEIREIGFPWSKELYKREKQIVGGTLECSINALKHGVSLNVAGGTHHAHFNKGSGFCILNDIAISVNTLLKTKKIKKALIVDLDVHQGDGTAKLFENKKQVFTFSMHGKKNYPLHKQKSDLDIELDDNTNDLEYLSLLNISLKDILNQFIPDIVFYQCGVDILSTDELGRLNVSMEGCRKRDEIVFNIFKSLNIPVVCTMGGGYSKQIKHILNAHCNTFKTAKKVWEF